MPDNTFSGILNNAIYYVGVIHDYTFHCTEVAAFLLPYQHVAEKHTSSHQCTNMVNIFLVTPKQPSDGRRS